MIQRIDIQGGQMTFGQRIELGRIITDKEMTDIDKMKEGMQCLGGKWSLRNTSEILEWKYGKVYNLLFTNLQSHLFRERLNKELERKAQQKANARKPRNKWR